MVQSLQPSPAPEDPGSLTPTRRQTLRAGAAASLLGVAGLETACRGPRATDQSDEHEGALETEQRSVLVVLVDQHRFDHAGYAGHPLAWTPSLDRLASQSTRFEACYAAVPLCAPARQSLVTGQPASFHGTFRNRHAAVEGERTLFHDITAGGHVTGFFGKTHCNVEGFGRVQSQDDLLEHRRQADPDTVLAGARRIVRDGPAAIPFLEPYNPRYQDAGRGSVFHMEEAVTSATLEFLAGIPKGRPFFAIASYLAPHPPLFPPEEFLERFREAPVVVDRSYRAQASDLPRDLRRRRKGQRIPRLQDEQADNIARAYLASLAWTDWCVGRLIDGVEALGLHRDTVVVYTSDHGELLGQHGLFGKRAFYEGAARVPLLVRDPRLGSRSRNLPRVVSHLDLAATFGAWAGISLAGLPGRDLRALLDPDASAPWVDEARLESCDGLGLPEPAGLQQPEGPQPPSAMSWALRRDQWKYLAHGSGEVELYDVLEDPGELRNLARDPGQAAVVRQCAERLREDSPATWSFHRTEDGRQGAPR